jgi:hypothetical protein
MVDHATLWSYIAALVISAGLNLRDFWNSR